MKPSYDRSLDDGTDKIRFRPRRLLLRSSHPSPYSLDYQARRQRRLVSARTLIRRFLSPDLIKQLAPLLRQTAVCSRPDLYSNRRYPHYV